MDPEPATIEVQVDKVGQLGTCFLGTYRLEMSSELYAIAASLKNATVENSFLHGLSERIFILPAGPFHLCRLVLDREIPIRDKHIRAAVSLCAGREWA